MRAVKVVLVLVALAVAGCGTTSGGGSSSGGSTTAKGPMKVAFIYAGDPHNGGWDQAHDMGRQALQKALGGQVRTSYKASVPQSPETARVIENLVQAGNRMIVATSYGYNQYMEAAARKHPDVKFLQMEQPTLMKNLGAFDLSEEDGFYVAGMMLAAATKHGHIGFVGSFPVPAIVRVVNALQLGAREINPKATVRTVWTNTWYEPAKERQASQSLISSGAEALTDDVGDPVPGQVAEDARVPWVGINVDQSSFAPTSWLTGVVFNYGPYYIQQAKAAMDGTWKPSQSYLRMSDDVVQLAPLGKRYDQEVSAADRKKIDARRKAIASGKQWVFTGPLRDQKGKLRVPAGKRMSIPELQSMNWLVEGVVGSTGKS